MPSISNFSNCLVHFQKWIFGLKRNHIIIFLLNVDVLSIFCALWYKWCMTESMTVSFDQPLYHLVDLFLVREQKSLLYFGTFIQGCYLLLAKLPKIGKNINICKRALFCWVQNSNRLSYLFTLILKKRLPCLVFIFEKQSTVNIFV